MYYLDSQSVEFFMEVCFNPFLFLFSFARVHLLSAKELSATSPHSRL